MAKKRLKPGDVLEIAVDNRTAYMQYLGEHSEYGGVIWVVPRTYATPPENVGSVVAEDGYFAFYPARTAVLRGFAQVVDSAPLEDREIPQRLRRAGARGADGTVLTWIVSQGNREVVKEVLSESERHLPIAAIWNHEMLALRVSEGWRPEHAR